MGSRQHDHWRASRQPRLHHWNGLPPGGCVHLSKMNCTKMKRQHITHINMICEKIAWPILVHCLLAPCCSILPCFNVCTFRRATSCRFGNYSDQGWQMRSCSEWYAEAALGGGLPKSLGRCTASCCRRCLHLAPCDRERYRMALRHPNSTNQSQARLKRCATTTCQQHIPTDLTL